MKSFNGSLYLDPRCRIACFHVCLTCFPSRAQGVTGRGGERFSSGFTVSTGFNCHLLACEKLSGH
ncbi:hypothetical protein B0I35DRAFT_420864 [Stachybotrys elegans]|uniref:Uncharacterized protein n=1 Tax=Stachybotrys elegans TaxID=80388 RepID=A0A8K0WV02_9HYPO|nr:hypothetical protein B0I35DRAFT_420864 [Stachybotrys elegans]